MTVYYYRPFVQTGPRRPSEALTLAGGWCWFTHVEVIQRGAPSSYVPAGRLPPDALRKLTASRAPLGELTFDEPRLMGILNVTPDSFSDGGRFNGAAMALKHAKSMAERGADIIDVGGESTRPGALEVPHEAEIARTAPVITALRSAVQIPISIDTRKAVVAAAALDAGADFINDVSGLTFDAALTPLCAEREAPVFVMHAQGTPQKMQLDPQYEDVVLDVYDYLAERIDKLKSAGIPSERIVVDPGIGFGKTIEHNLKLLSSLSLFHSLGCAILLGVSRKGFIRKIGLVDSAQESAHGSVATGLVGIAQGVQLLRVHDVGETKQALRLWLSATRGEY
ncbi:dihydropteroate synthase [Lentibacter sp. XHP0401]|uniref:dihydropteroate synthase n=1 Tax=Lentibacter sp. XHP0401 TaxID=2984334 RepID=UPI0021E98D9D|nr:dihydropteroate synthase [Lentibacter sp. XHP0401]MCV2894599.1 dihydropteroate synthase [Lentibacter sp. XHP0401]